MKNKVILLMSTILITTSCGVNETQLKQSIKYENGMLSINIKSSKQHHLICKYSDETFIDTLFNGTINMNLEDYVEYPTYEEYNTAYSLITKGYIPIYINLDSKIDTILPGRIKLASENNLYAKVISGKIFPIERYYLSEIVQNDIQQWLPTGDVTAIDMGNLLTRMQPQKYIATNPIIDPDNIPVYPEVDSDNSIIPVLKSFDGQKYKIESNLDADNYYLYAPVNILDLNDFIQNMIKSRFPASVKNLNSTLSCFRRKGEGGRFVVFLIGINNNGAYSYIPVGLVAIDNVKPVVCDDRNYSYYRIDRLSVNRKYIYNCNLSLYYIPIGLPDVQEWVIISNGQFRGNDVLFEVSFTSGIESISIKREIYHDYMRYSYKPETKTIRLSDKENPYHFRYVLDLFIGDNYIPITVTDKFGNSTNYTYKITMEEVKDDD